MGGALADDVREAQHHRAHAEQIRIGRDVGFGRELARAIEGDRLQRAEILVQHRRGLTEDRRRAGKEEPARAVDAHRFEHAQRGELVQSQVEIRVGDAGRDVGVRRHVKHGVEFGVGEERVELLALEHVECDEVEAVG